jgi:hypothetical protein
MDMIRAGQYSTAEDNTFKGRSIQHSRGERSTGKRKDSTAQQRTAQVRAGQYSTAEESALQV